MLPKHTWVLFERRRIEQKLNKLAKELITVCLAEVELELEEIAEKASKDNAVW